MILKFLKRLISMQMPVGAFPYEPVQVPLPDISEFYAGGYNDGSYSKRIDDPSAHNKRNKKQPQK